MFVVTYIESSDTHKVFVEKLLTLIDYKEASTNNSSTHIIVSNSFTLYVYNREEDVMFKNEDYKKEFNVRLDFEVITNSEWASDIMSVVGELLKLYKGSILVEANGDIPIVFRNIRTVIVDSSKLKGSIEFPFHKLDMEYIINHLEQI